MALNNTLKNANTTQSELFNYYLTMNLNNICRICLEKGPKLMPIFDPLKPPHFSVLIMECASVQVVQGDGLPPYICQKCISRLNVAFQFKTQCENSDAKLRQCFENLNSLPAAPDLSGYIDNNKKDSSQDNLSFVSDSNSSSQENQVQQCTGAIQEMSDLEDSPTIQIQIEEEQVLEPLQNVQLATFSCMDQGMVKTELNELKLDYIDLKSDMDQNLTLNNITQSTNNKTPKTTKQHQCDTCGKIFRTKPSLIHHIRIHTGERPYICHLCDKSFVNGGHLHTHMRTHTGEKNHICAACSKAFATAQQLTKHTIAIHTSERPYACTYCPKRFASSSNLNTHTRIHTGEKNYHCDQCGKAFSTKGQLYQHMLVHTGEKAFMCEYCNKRFSQKAHLMRHLKMHRQMNAGV